jgi:hypothetical protein
MAALSMLRAHRTRHSGCTDSAFGAPLTMSGGAAWLASSFRSAL